MREDYALRYLARVVNWSESKLSNEAGWLRRIAAYKYDSYQDFFAGERFISSLIRWLMQFAPGDRDYAYKLLREHLVFLSAPEIQHLVRRTVPAHVRPLWVKRIAGELGISPHEIWASKVSTEAYEKLVRRTLFIGLSDGARMDVFRRANIGVVNNEQVAVGYELSSSKLQSLVDDLREREGVADAKFEMVFLIDDFLGSGTTLCRQKTGGGWRGKMHKFGDVIEEKHTEWFADNFGIVAHHYIATSSGLGRAKLKLEEFSAATTNPVLAKKSFVLTADLILDDAIRFPKGKDAKMDAFLHRYYDPQIMTKSLREGECEVHNGFADGGLTVVLEHNTPNNTMAIIWAESSDSAAPAGSHRMRPLFRRRQRHD